MSNSEDHFWIMRSENERWRHEHQAERDLALHNEQLRPFFLLRPRMFPDGNKWCALYGDNIQDGVAGFGDTPDQAAIQFDIEWLNAPAKKGDGNA